MSDMDPLYDLMKASAQDMSKAAVEMKLMMTKGDAEDVPVAGYGNAPSFAKQIASRVADLVNAPNTVLTYKTKAGMDADKSKPLNTLAVVAESSKTYYWDGVAWVEVAADLGASSAKKSAGTIAHTTTLLLPQDFSATGFVWDTNAGVLVADTNAMQSEPIAVSKGDCFRINNMSLTNTYYENAVLLDADKNFVGLLCATRTAKVDRARMGGATPEDICAGYLVSPRDGYIVFQYPASSYVGVESSFSVQRISWETMCDSWTLDRAQAGVIKSFNGKVFSPVYKATKRSLGLIGSQVVGQALKYSVVADACVTERIPVKAGQYIHYSTAVYASRKPLVFTNVDDNFLFMSRGNNDIIGCNAELPEVTHHFSANIPVVQDGFVRMDSYALGGYLAFIVVTDSPVELNLAYVDQYKAIEPIKGAGYFTGTYQSDSFAAHYTYTTRSRGFLAVSANIAEVRERVGIKTVTSKPLFVKKGQIVAYKGKFQTPYLAFAGTLYGVFDSNATDAALLPNYHLLVAPSVLPQDVFVQWKTRGMPEVLPAIMQEGEVHFYAEDADYVLYLQGYEDSNGNAVFGELLVFEGVTAYKRYRDKTFLPSLKWGAGVINATTYSIKYEQLALNGFIAFDDEIAQTPKVGTWQQSRLNGVVFEEAYQLFAVNMQIASMYAAPLTSASDYDKPKDGKGFYYMAGVSNQTRYVFGSCAGYYSYKDSNGNTIISATSADNLLSAFPPRVVDRNDTSAEGVYAVLPQYVSVNINNYGQPKPAMVMRLTNDTEVLAVPVFKDRYYYAKYNCAWVGSGIPVFFDITDGSATEVAPLVNTGIAQSLAGVTRQSGELFFKAPNNGYLFVPRLKELTGDAAKDPFLVKRFAETMVLDAKQIEKDEYDSRSVPTESKEMTIPAEAGLRINILGYLPVDTTKTVRTEVVLQFMLGDALLGVANAEMNISGSGTVSDPKPGFNLKLSNKKGKKLKLKVGSFNASHKWGLKAYYLEGTQSRDTGSNMLYRAMRRTRRPFIGPETLLSNGLGDTTRLNWFDRPFSTEGTPIELFVGGAFYGLYTLRTRAEAQDYLMADDKSTHIRILPNYGLHNAYANWGKFDQTYWSILNPEVDGYNEGDATIGDENAQASISRLGKFFTDLQAGSLTLTDSVVDSYFDREAVIDFFVFSQVVGNRDGIRNNVTVATWDGNIWGLYPYDLDRTAGFDWGTTALSPSDNTIYQDAALNKLINFLLPEIKDRYRELRSSGLLTAEGITQFYSDAISRINPNKYEVEQTFWDISGRSYQNLRYIYTWYVSRLAWIDTKWM